MAPIAAGIVYFMIGLAPQDGGKGGFPDGFKFPQGGDKSSISSLLGGPIDISGELAKPGVAVVYGTIQKISEGKKERTEGDLGLGASKAIMSGTVFYKIECTADIAVTDAFCGDVKGKTQNVQFDIQSAKNFDGKEMRQILSEPKHEFETPFTGLFVLEREKGKKVFRVTRIQKFDIKNDKSADPAGNTRKKAADYYGISRKKADYVALLDSYNSARDAKEKASVVKRLKALVEAAPKWQLVETDPVASGVLAPYEKRAKDFIAEYERENAKDNPPGDKPPGEK